MGGVELACPALDLATSQEVGAGTPGVGPGCQGMTRTKAEITNYTPVRAKPVMLWRPKSWLRTRGGGQESFTKAVAFEVGLE